VKLAQIPIFLGSAPDLKNKSYKIGAHVEIPEGGAEGVKAMDQAAEQEAVSD
jgi:hypothetical protein